MKEKLMSLPLAELREIAKAGGLKGITGLKKEALVDLMIEEDSRRKSAEAAEDAAKAEMAAKAVRIDSSKKVECPSPEKRYAEAAQKKRQNKKPDVGSDEPAGRVQNESEQNKSEQNKSVQAEADKIKSEQHKSTEQPKSEQPRSEQTKSEQPKQEPGVYVMQEGDSPVTGILEVMPEGYGFIRSDNYLPGDQDVYVSPVQIRSFRLKTGDVLTGIKKSKGEKEKFSPLAFLEKANGRPAREIGRRTAFENLTPIFPDHRIKLETPGCSVAMRAMDLVSPVGKGQRGMIVSPPKAGKTSLLKEVAHSMLRNDPLTHLLILLIDERPEEVTDIKEAIIGQNVEVIYSTFDEQPEHHMRVAEMVIERAKRLVELGEDVVILLDSITRLTRAYNQVIPPSGRTLSGGLDPAALHMPKRFFGAARNMREGGSLTILATALVETGSKMDDVVYEEFKGTGNMEIILDRKLSEKRIFPAIDLAKSGTRREDLLLNSDELEAINIMRKALNGLKPDEATDRILNMFANTRNNSDFVQLVKKNKFL